MIKKYICNFIVVGALILGVGVVNTMRINSAMAFQQVKKCNKCGHFVHKPEGSCLCECHASGGG